ncbi:hypothetical protein O181_104233, partial [Austropuccinia psidii MF-1]|nr:hypothetical protein [Austropuccinia psidii MF-1]
MEESRNDFCGLQGKKAADPLEIKLNYKLRAEISVTPGRISRQLSAIDFTLHH